MFRIACLSFLLTGCGDALGIGTDIEYAPGTYDTTGNWNLGGPLAGDRTLGDAVAEALVGEMVGVLGVPGPLHDQAFETIHGLVATRVAGAVDTLAPTELAPNSTIVRALSASLADIEVRSTIGLAEASIPTTFEGEEIIELLAYTHNGTRYEITADDLAAGVEISAEWSGRASGTQLLVDDHLFALRFGELVKRIAAQLIDFTEQQNLADQAAAAMDCPNLVSLILDGDTEFTIGIDGFSGSLSGAQLSGACDTVQSLTGDKVLGMFKVGELVEIGGAVDLVASGDRATGMTSAAGYGGTVNIVPKPLAPRVQVTFSATRR